MEITEYRRLEMLAHEAFIRRASKIDLPFMLKGSYVTRQYFPVPDERIPADLDWLYMEKLHYEETARQRLSEWVTLVTELELNDGVTFRSFKENEFWRRIDYAMADDFPTVNTDIKCWVNNQVVDFGLDVSFNLDIEQPPVSLLYKPLEEEEFVVPYTVPLSLQVSWKIHQTLVRPRFKDLYDLIFLVQHPSFNEQSMAASLQALVNECKADNVDLSKLSDFLSYSIHKLYPGQSIELNWDFWRHGQNNGFDKNILYYDKAEYITDPENLPVDLTGFLNHFRLALEKAGFGIHLMEKLPEATVQKRGTFHQASEEQTTSTESLQPETKAEQGEINPVQDTLKQDKPEGKLSISQLKEPRKGFFDFIKRLFN